MSEQNKATIVRVFNHGQTELRLSEKGAVTVYLNTDRGPQFRFSLRPADVELMAQEMQSPSFQAVVESPEWAQVHENKEKNKAASYAVKSINRALDREKQIIQAAIDKLKAAGMDPEKILAQVKTKTDKAS